MLEKDDRELKTGQRTQLKQGQVFNFGDLQKRDIVEYLVYSGEISEELWLNSRRKLSLE